MLGNICNLLSSERFENEANVQRAGGMKDDAYRKLALAEWLVKMEERRVAMEDPSQNDMPVVLLTWLVEQRKVQLATEEESLPHSVNAVSPPPSSTEEEPKRFDLAYYQALPGPVVRERLLSFVQNPQDLLNLLEAIPLEAKFSDRSKEEFQFELEFPEMLRNGRASWDANTWNNDLLDLQELASVSKNHRKVILAHLENFLVNDIANDDRHFRKGSIEVCTLFKGWVEYTSTTQRIDMFPETCQVVGSSALRSNHYALENAGRAIWDFKLHLNHRVDLEYLWSNLCWYLNFMPDLRNLFLAFGDQNWSDEFDEFEFKDYGREVLSLPELAYLRSLKFHGSRNEPDFFIACNMLLEKYGGQLNKLQFEIAHDLADIPVGLPPCPKLAILVIEDNDTSNYPHVSMALRLLSNFETSPLKMLKLKLKDTRLRMALYQVLECASLKFGGTLEHLEVKIICGSGRWRTESPPDAYQLLHSVQLPKLKHFATNVNPMPDGWSFLLLLPKLESLHVDRTRIEEQGIEDAEEAFKDVDSAKGSELWKLLPHLKIIQLDEGKCTVTRQESMDLR